MKTKLFFGVIVLVLMIGISTTHAQNRPMQNNKQRCLLQEELSQEQRDKMDELRTAFYQKTKADHNKLNELMAKKRTLETTDPVDEKALFDCLASINDIKANLEKARVRHFQDVKSILSDEQVVLFDARKKGWMNNRGQGFGKNRGGNGIHGSQGNVGYGRGNGQGLGRNHGQGKGRGQGQGRGQGYGNGQGCQMMNLTDEQKEYVEQTRIEMLAKEQGIKNRLDELNAQLKTKTTGKTIDLKAVDKIIAEKAELNLQVAKLRANHRMGVRNQFTDEQKAAFDTRSFRGRRNGCRR